MKLNNPIDTVENCRYCLMCRHVAPVGHITKDETLTPHGIALTVASQRRGLIQWNRETVAVIYSEPDGGNCRAHCITDQPLPEAIAAVRAELTAQDLAPAIVYRVHEALEKWHTPFGEERLAPATGRAEVALFVGDEAHYLWPSALEGALKLLEAVGLRPTLIGRGRSSGYLASSLGFPETATRQGQELLAELSASGASRLLVLSPGDYFTFNQLYPERLGIALPPEVALNDVASVLAEALADGRLPLRASEEPTPYAYVDPTHAVRVPQRFDAPRALVGAVMPSAPLELFWRRERAHPVGSTALQFTRPELADALTRARLEDAKNRGAELLICEDPGSLYQLKQHAGALSLRVKGLYELLAEHIAC
ncbi:MAG: (Fe-S)-binding protein [Trueperaceae bacterium]|nr:MAG: (Fe-S)-binding protein [Trueperaceae bacterium]